MQRAWCAVRPRAAAPSREARQRLVALDHPALDRIVVGPVVHQVPGLVRDVPGSLRRGPARTACRPAVISNAWSCSAGCPAASSARVACGIAPHLGRDHQPVAQLHLVHDLVRPLSPGRSKRPIPCARCRSSTSPGVLQRRRLRGQPARGVPRRHGIPGDARQAIAAHLGLSETVFVDDAGRGELRIFTPTVELEFAGHPSVGSRLAAAAERAPRWTPSAAGRRRAGATRGPRAPASSPPA